MPIFIQSVLMCFIHDIQVLLPLVWTFIGTLPELLQVFSHLIWTRHNYILLDNLFFWKQIIIGPNLYFFLNYFTSIIHWKYCFIRSFTVTQRRNTFHASKHPLLHTKMHTFWRVTLTLKMIDIWNSIKCQNVKMLKCYLFCSNGIFAVLTVFQLYHGVSLIILKTSIYPDMTPIHQSYC